MHKNVIICTCMIINNLALRSGGAVVRKRKAIKNSEKKKGKWKKKEKGTLDYGREGEVKGKQVRREGERRTSCFARVYPEDKSVCSSLTNAGVQRGKKGGGVGGLAAAVTSSFMNSLYFCSVQINVRSCWKKWQKNTKHDHLSRILHPTLTVSRVAVQMLWFDRSYRIFRRSNKVSIA